MRTMLTTVAVTVMAALTLQVGSGTAMAANTRQVSNTSSGCATARVWRQGVIDVMDRYPVEADYDNGDAQQALVDIIAARHDIAALNHGKTEDKARTAALTALDEFTYQAMVIVTDPGSADMRPVTALIAKETTAFDALATTCGWSSAGGSL